MELAWQQKLQELEVQFHRDDQVHLRQKLLNGTENPYAAIEQLRNDKERLLSRRKAEIIEQLTEKGLILRSPLPQVTEELFKIFQEFLESTNQQNSSERFTSETQSVENHDDEKKENNTGEA